MRERQPYTAANVPLRREHLRQASLFDGTLYFLPTVTPGQEALVYDADAWRSYNGRRGIVTRYSYFSGLHTIELEAGRGTYEGKFLGREIMAIREDEDEQHEHRQARDKARHMLSIACPIVFDDGDGHSVIDESL